MRESLFGRLLAKVGRDEAFNWAVIVAWNFLLSLFPIVLVMAALLGVALGWIGVGSAQVYRAVLSIIPDPGARQQALQALGLFHQRSGIFFLVGFAGLVWSGAGLFRTMEQAFAVIHGTERRPFLNGVLMSIGMVFLLTVFGGLSLVSTTVLGLLTQLPYLPGLFGNAAADFVLQFLLGFGAGLGLFLCIYYVVPNRRQSWARIWRGALLAGFLFEVLSLLFPLYLGLTGTAATYGKTFGLLFLLMVYFYFLGIVTMLGAELNSLLYPPGSEEYPHSSRWTSDWPAKRSSSPAAPTTSGGASRSASPPRAPGS